MNTLRRIARPAAAVLDVRWAQPLPALRRLLGGAIAVGGALLIAGHLADAALRALESSAALRQGVAASLLAGLATGLGALPLLFVRRVGERAQGGLFALAGGLMAGAALFGLLGPAFATAGEPGASGVVAAALAGALAILAFDRLLPHLHEIPAGQTGRAARQSCWLMVVAIGLHNLPEGLAVGASFQGGATDGNTTDGLGVATALGIGVQNLPEGLIVAMALILAGSARLVAIAVATLTGLFEPLGALAGGAAAGLSAAALPLAMSFAAGAMLFVVAHDALPNAARRIDRRRLAAAFAAGGVGMALLAV